MSDEMLTIELTAEDAEFYSSGRQTALSSACRKALDARKGEYERWRENIQSYGEDWHRRGRIRRAIDKHTSRKLISAAPALLDALITLCQDPDGCAIGQGKWDLADNAIRAALPKEVADEVLGYG